MFIIIFVDRNYRNSIPNVNIAGINILSNSCKAKNILLFKIFNAVYIFERWTKTI